MGVAWVYPATLEPDDNGTILVSFPDVPEAHTFGDDAAEALRRGVDALVTALEGYMGSRRPVPRPSTVMDDALSVALPMLTAAKVELYEAMREAGWRKADLAKRLGWHGPQVDRLLDLRHSSRADQLHEALAKLNRTLVIRGADLKPGVPLPAAVAPGQRFQAARRTAARKVGGIAAKRHLTKSAPTRHR